MIWHPWPSPGTVVYIWFCGVFRHKGVVSDRIWAGKPMVIANSWATKGVAEIPWDDFAGGQPVYSEAPPSTLHPHVVLYHARTLIGERYDVIRSNCEHFICKCYGVPAQSPQLAAMALVAIGAVTVLLAAQSRPALA